MTWLLSSTCRLLNDQVAHFLAPPASFSMVTTLYHYTVYTTPPYCWGPNHFLSLVYHFGNTTSAHAVNPHTPHTCQMMTMPSHHDPHTHATDVEAAEKCFHISGALAQCRPTRCRQPHRSGGTGSAKTQVKHVQRDTNWLVFDVNIWCYVGSLILSAHIGHIPKLQNARQQNQPIQ